MDLGAPVRIIEVEPEQEPVQRPVEQPVEAPAVPVEPEKEKVPA